MKLTPEGLQDLEDAIDECAILARIEQDNLRPLHDEEKALLIVIRRLAEVVARKTLAPEPSPAEQILLGFVRIMDRDSKNPDGVSVTDLEELALEARSCLYTTGVYTTPGPIAPHWERLEAERRQLADRLRKLTVWLMSGAASSQVSPAHRALLDRQRGLMEDYLGVLDSRLLDQKS